LEREDNAMRRKNAIKFILLIIVMFLIGSAGSESLQQTPGQYFKERLEKMKAMTETFNSLSHKPNLPQITGNWANFLSEGDPDKAFNLSQWSERHLGYEFPLVWNDNKKRFEAMPLQIENSSDAVVKFTWYFLKSYNKLHPELRQSESTLAMGCAALVASEVVYPENWACLPVELQDATAIANIMILYCPDLLKECYDEKSAKWKDLSSEAMRKMCSTVETGVGKENGGTGREQTVFITNSIHRDGSWVYRNRIDLAYENHIITLNDFLPPHPQSLNDLLGKVKNNMTNLTLRGNIIRASCPFRFGLPSLHSNGEEQNKVIENWSGEFKDLLKEIREDLQKREVTLIAPEFKSDHIQVIKSDPSVLRPLIEISGECAAQELKLTIEKGPEAFLEVLKTNPITRQVLEISGSDPIIELSRVEGEIPRLARLTWEQLIRVPPHENEKIRTEKVIVELVDYQDISQGKPKKGVNVEAWVTILEDGKPTRIQAGEVQTGMKILGYANLGHPSSNTPVRLNKDLIKKNWFTVLEIQRHKAPLSLSLGLCEIAQLENPSQVQGNIIPRIESIELSVYHKVFIAQGEIGVWTNARDIDPQSTPWCEKNFSYIEWLKKIFKPLEIVEFSMTGEERGQANNFVVSASRDEKSCNLLVEARSVDAGPIHPGEPILLFDNSTKDIGKVECYPDIDNPGFNIIPPPTIVGGFHKKAQTDLWEINPDLSRHNTYVLKKNINKVEMAYKLEFDDNSAINIGENNWLFVYQNKVLKEVRAEQIQPGTDVVSDVSKGEIQTIKLKKITPIPKPPQEYVLLELVNLPWAKVGPIVISVDFRDHHTGISGVKNGVLLALSKETSVNDQTSSPTNRSIDFSSYQLPFAPYLKLMENPGMINNILNELPNLINQSILTYDYALHNFAPGRIGKIIPIFSSRCVEIEVKRDNRTKILECGELQSVFVKKEDESVKAEGAFLLQPGDSIFVTEPGDKDAMAWPVTRVTPLFYPLELIYDLATAERQNIYGSYYGDSNIAFGNSLGIILKKPVTGSFKGFFRKEEEGLEGLGEATARHQGNHGGGKYDVTITKEGPIIRTKPVEDMIFIPPAARKQLEERARALVNIYQEESKNLSPTDHSPIMKFWQNLVTSIESPTPLKISEDMTQGGRPDSSLEQAILECVEKQEKIDDDNRISQKELFNSSYISKALEDNLNEMIQIRGEFLTTGDRAKLRELLFMEIASASLLQVSGASRVTDLLLMDLIELAIYAGCEQKGREKNRLGPDMELPVITHIPRWIKKEPPLTPDKDIRINIGTYALDTAKKWSDEWGYKEIVGDRDISLYRLFSRWSLMSDRGLIPYWEDIPQPDEDGKLPLETESAQIFHQWLEKAIPLLIQRREERLNATQVPLDREPSKTDIEKKGEDK
jgi:hypothetical protein